MNEGLITIAYDNKLYDKNLKSGWGFSCLIEHLDKKVLFDTGDDSEKLSFNLKALNIDPEDIDTVVLSHNHWDHTGGLEAIIDKNSDAVFYFPEAFPNSFRQGLKERGVKSFPVNKMLNISEGIYAGPQINGFGPREIPLTVKTTKGLVIITGCAHPGISKMVKEVKRNLNKEIYLVLGGFHLGGSSGTNYIISELKRLEVQKVAPCHCTGEGAIRLFEESFKENFIRVGAGLKIKIGE